MRSQGRIPVLRQVGRVWFKGRATKTRSLELPDSGTSLNWCLGAEFPTQLRLAAANFWYDHDSISQRWGVEIAGLTSAEFIDGLG
jgi:hypothetical protein